MQFVEAVILWVDGVLKLCARLLMCFTRSLWPVPGAGVRGEASILQIFPKVFFLPLKTCTIPIVCRTS